MVTRHATVRTLTGEQAASTPDKIPLGIGARVARARKARRPTAQSAPVPKANGKDGYTFKQLGHDLRVVRERRGLSQQDVAKRLGRSLSTVADLENGRGKVKLDDLSRLAHIFGCTVRDIFEPKAKAHLADLSAALHRSLPELRRAKGIESEIMRFVLACHDGVVMRGLLKESAFPAIPEYPSRATNASDAIIQGETAARMERGRLGVGDMPLENLPGLLNNAGIWSLATKLPEDLSGVFLCHPTVGLAILVNRGHEVGQRNVSCAHEYAHAIFDRKETVTATRRAVGADLREMRANVFAAAFLMPADEVAIQLGRLGKGFSYRRKVVGYDAASGKPHETEIRSRPGSQTITPPDIATLALHFCVSQEAMIMRLQALGHISSKERDALIDGASLGREYASLLEPKRPSGAGSMQNTGESEFRRQVMRVAFEAYRSAGISGGRLREIARNLSLDGFPLSRLAEELFENE